jgi:pyridoxamine 5'-phosphate oxidase
MEKELLDQLNALIDETRSIVVCSVDGEGFPNAKAMFKTEHEGLKTFLFSTNTSSMRVGQFRRDPKASIYFLGQSKINGLMLIGTMEICTDHETKARLWWDGCEQYYPLGVDDPDYCVLKFTAERGNFYFNLRKHTFDIE